MLRIYLLLLIPASFILVSCTNDRQGEEISLNTEEKPKKEFEMYEMSEMTVLMRQMYQVNEQLKERILAGEDIGDYSASFERILEAEQTGGKAIDDFFKSHAETFLALQRSIYDNPAEATDKFNAAVDACIACHKVKCTGPIQKIEKLYIK